MKIKKELDKLEAIKKALEKLGYKNIFIDSKHDPRKFEISINCEINFER